MLGFCFFAVVAAGTRLPGTAAVGVLIGTAVGVAYTLRESQPTSIAIAVLGLAGVLLLGMGRRESVRRAEERELQLVNAARVQEEHARAAALAERARIARDVHDVLAHSLSALAVQLQGARLMLLRDGAPADTVAQIERAQHLASEGLAEARRAVTALRAAPVDLADGLRALIADAPEATLEIDGAADGLSATAQETVLRTAQEALTNARRHAAGAPVSVRLSHPRRRHGAGGPRPAGHASAAVQRGLRSGRDGRAGRAGGGRAVGGTGGGRMAGTAAPQPPPRSPRRRPDDRPRGPRHAARAVAGRRRRRGRARGERAVALVAELAPDVLLTDLRMPVCDGVEATRRVRATPRTAVVVLTTYADDASVVEALRAGAAGLALEGRRRRSHRPGAALGRRGHTTVDSAAHRPPARRRRRRRGRPSCPTGSPPARPRCWA